MTREYDHDNIGTILLMLDSICPSPCYCFAACHRGASRMSPETLEAAFGWMSQLKPSPPGIVYMVGDAQALDEGTRRVLNDGADSVICIPMHPTRQSEAGLPFRVTQMLVYSSLAEFERDRGYTGGRSCLIHVGREEISRLSTVLGTEPTRDNIAELRLRPRDLPLWDRSHVKAYQRQLIELRTLQFRLEATGTPVCWELGLPSRCPAMKTLVTIGPDGLCYPCPAFYHAGQSCGLGATETLDNMRLFGRRLDGTCRLCHAPYCEACLFWEMGLAEGEATVCDLHKGMDIRLAKETIIWHSNLSSYMLESLRNEKMVARERDDDDEYKSLWASGHTDDLSLQDLTTALRSIHQAAHALVRGEVDVLERLVSEYEQDISLAPRSRKILFSHDQFTKALEEIHRQASVGTSGALEISERLISQYDSATDAPAGSMPISRKTFFLQKVRDILLALADLREIIEERPVLFRDGAAGGSNASDAQAQDGMGRLPLSEPEVAFLRSLYEMYLGWMVLHRATADAVQTGFPVEEQRDVAHKEMVEAGKRMNRWFDEAGKRHGWKQREGYTLAVDFEARLETSWAHYQKIRPGVPGPKNGSWFRIMPLDGIEKEVMERLANLQETALVVVKEYLGQYLEGLDVRDDLEAAVKMLGCRFFDMKRWYYGMAKECNWPDVEVRASPDFKWVEGRQV